VAPSSCLADRYLSGDCVSEAFSRVSDTENQLDIFALLLYCDDSGSPDGLTKVEAKCQDTVAKTLAKFGGAKGKCYDKCVSNDFNGKIPDGSCVPPASDPPTQACITKAEGKSIAAINKACADAPECYGLNTGTTWTGLAEGAVDNSVVDTYCSPSGAFLN